MWGFRPAQEACGDIAKRAPTAPIWGDGFEDDTFRHIASVTEWDNLSSDEFLRLYPRLLCGRPPLRVLTHAQSCIATLCLQAFALPDRCLRSVAFDRLEFLASTHGPVWSPAPTKSYLDGLVGGELRLLDEMLAHILGGDTTPFRPDQTELFAFHTGIHPAYFWPEAISTHQRLTTFGWLGVVMRGRSALMSHDIAEYLYESAAEPNGDNDLSCRMGSGRLAAILARHAAIRLRNRSVVSSASPWCTP